MGLLFFCSWRRIKRRSRANVSLESATGDRMGKSTQQSKPIIFSFLSGPSTKPHCIVSLAPKICPIYRRRNAGEVTSSHKPGEQTILYRTAATTPKQLLQIQLRSSRRLLQITLDRPLSCQKLPCHASRAGCIAKPTSSLTLGPRTKASGGYARPRAVCSLPISALPHVSLLTA